MSFTKKPNLSLILISGLCLVGIVLGSAGDGKQSVEPVTFNQSDGNNATSINNKSEIVKLECPLGYEDTSDKSEKLICAKCALGHFRNSSMEKCSKCPPGSEALMEGMKECTLCFYGKYRKDEAKCHDCPSGYISLNKGAAMCQKCPQNFYCPCAICHPIKCATRGFCPEGSESPLYCDYPLMKRTGLDSGDCVLTSELIGLICGAVLLIFLLLSVILANIFLKQRTDAVLMSRDSGSSRYLLQNASSSSDLRYLGL